jgi:hypothetical protein
MATRDIALTYSTNESICCVRCADTTPISAPETAGARNEENFWVKPGSELLGVTARGVLARLLAGVNSIKLGDRMRDIQPAVAWYVASLLAGEASPGTKFLAKRKKNGAADVLCEILNR